MKDMLATLYAALLAKLPRDEDGKVCFTREKVLQTQTVRTFTGYPDRQLVEFEGSLVRYLYIYPEVRRPDIGWTLYDGLPIRAIHTGLFSVEWGIMSKCSANRVLPQDGVETHVHA